MDSDLLLIVIIGLCVIIGVIIGVSLNIRDKNSLRKAKYEAQQMLSLRTIMDINRAKAVQKRLGDAVWRSQGRELELEDLWKKLRALMDEQKVT